MKAVNIIKHLAHSKIISETAVIHAFYPIVSAKTGAGVYRKSPTIVHQTGGIGAHNTETIKRTVRKHADTLAGTHAERISKNVSTAVVAAEAH